MICLVLLLELFDANEFADRPRLRFGACKQYEDQDAYKQEADCDVERVIPGDHSIVEMSLAEAHDQRRKHAGQTSEDVGEAEYAWENENG